MNKSEALANVGKLTEIELITVLKLLKESSYGVLSKVAREKAIERFKSKKIGKEYYESLTEEEINIIIEYTLARVGLMENEHELRHIENKSSKTPDRDER